MFDKRWICSIRNPFNELLLLAPLLLNAITIVALIV
jgi:hypothetical protein